MQKTLQDKIAVVTGGAQGLGAAICRRLADEGAHIVVADINLEGAQETAATIEEVTGRRAIAVKADVTQEDDVAAMIDRTIET
ncbi:MAG: SDR family NAD(P)-dependent oxidoreductase, partial [Anaerolineae bacterium]